MPSPEELFAPVSPDSEPAAPSLPLVELSLTGLTVSESSALFDVSLDSVVDTDGVLVVWLLVPAPVLVVAFVCVELLFAVGLLLVDEGLLDVDDALPTSVVVPAAGADVEPGLEPPGSVEQAARKAGTTTRVTTESGLKRYNFVMR